MCNFEIYTTFLASARFRWSWWSEAHAAEFSQPYWILANATAHGGFQSSTWKRDGLFFTVQILWIGIRIPNNGLPRQSSKSTSCTRTSSFPAIFFCNGWPAPSNIIIKTLYYPLCSCTVKKKTHELLNKLSLNEASHNYLTLYETILLLKEFNAWLRLPNLKLNLLNTHLTANNFILTTHYKFHSCLHVLNSWLNSLHTFHGKLFQRNWTLTNSHLITSA